MIAKIEQSKYINSLTKEQIIRNLNDCIQDNECIINYEAFCQHTANFRVQTIADVLKNIGLSDIINAIKRNSQLKELEMVKKVGLFVEEMDKIGFEKALPYLTNKAYKIDEIYNPISESHTKTKLLCFCFDGVKIAVGDIVIV